MEAHKLMSLLRKTSNFKRILNTSVPPGSRKQTSLPIPGYLSERYNFCWTGSDLAWVGYGVGVGSQICR